jgi:predicted ATPase/class 3 adenylate cyclase
MASLPAGTVTFLFTDIEGSTRLLQRLGDRYANVLATHHRLLRNAIEEVQGQVVDTQGDAVFAAFPRARDALLAAIAAQRAVQAHPWPDGIAPKVRVGLHTGEPVTGETGYVGMDVHRAARVAAAGHGGQILMSDVTHSLVAKDLPDGVTLRDLGEHRLKDLAHPHRLFQVMAPDLPADFPPLQSLDAHPHNLPIQLTSFIGRAREIAEIKTLLSQARLITLTGSGGAGKTRLALQVAAEVVESYADGVWLAEFAPIADPALVPKTVASTLSVPEQPGRDMTVTLVDALRPKEMLLVLDNCEHLLVACADLAAALLRACPRVRILATSREGLGVPGETLWRVPSLSLPDVRRLPPSEDLVLYEAVRLFVDRAIAVTSGFTVTNENAAAIAQVCHRLDGIPLAIELAAARVKVLAVEQIATRLDDRFRLLTRGSRMALPHHQTLQAAMDWSHALLSENEKALFRRLSVFAGGWTLEAGEAICAGGEVEASDILDFLAQLVDKSLVAVETHHGKARYRLLETVRQYGMERLSESGEAGASRQRHRDWYLEWAEHVDRKLRTAEQDVWVERLRTEHENLRAALEWSMEAGGGEPGLRLAVALAWFWYIDGHWSEGRKWLEQALALGGDVRTDTLADALLQAAYHARSQGDYERARAFAEKGLTIARETDNRGKIAWFLCNLGIIAVHEGEYNLGKALCEESVALGRQFGMKFLLATALAQLGHIARDSPDYQQATTFYGESLAFAREHGEKYTIAYALRNIAVLALHVRDYERAGALFAESLALCRATPSWVTEECLVGMAEIACAERRYERAACLFGAGDALHQTLGVRRAPRIQVHYDERVAATRAGLGDAAFATAWAEGRAMTLEQAIECGLASGRPSGTV